MYPGMVNSPITELAAAIDETQTTIEVIDGTKLPDAPNLAIIGLGEDAETILYTEKTGNVLSGVTRGFQGVAKAWGQGARIARFFTEYDQRAMMQNIQENADNLAAHLNETVTDGVHGMGAAAEQDYEEGIFTPELMFGGSSEGITYTTQEGEYTRIGRIVHIEIEIALSSKGLATGQALIYGLPFIASSHPVRGLTIGHMQSVSLPSDFVYPSAVIYENYAHIGLRYTNNAGGIDNFTNSHFNNNTRITITGTYRIS